MLSEKHLIWIDLEMTGLDPDKDRIIEIATLITDFELHVIAEGPNLVIKQTEACLSEMDTWNITHHGQSGLLEAVQNSTCDEAAAEAQTLAFLAQYVPAGVSPMCGNSICQDRRFLVNYMPDLAAYFHYRHLDVSSVKLLFQYWYTHTVSYKKESGHRALADIYDSIEELKFYRKQIFIA